jgi:hypothetical protein
VLHLLTGLLAGVWVLGLLSGLPGTVSVTAAGLAVPLAAWLHTRSGWLRGFLQMLGFISPLVVLFFLFLSPAKKLLFAEAGVIGGVAGADTPVVVLVLDELSQAAITTATGDIDRRRLPGFARLADISTWYSNTTTASTQTERAVPAILSGRRPDKDSQPIVRQYPQNLFSMLGLSHRVSAQETYTRLCPTEICGASPGGAGGKSDPASLYADAAVVYLHTLLPRQWAERWLPSIAHSWHGFQRAGNDGATPGEKAAQFAAVLVDMSADTGIRFNRFLQDISESKGPTFTYLHLDLPHIPWIHLPDGKVYNGVYAPGQSKTVYDWVDNQHLVDQGILRYNLQIEYVDRLLGRLLDVLAESPRFDETLFIVVSDHGLVFVPGEHRRVPTAETLADVARIPLFIKYPGQAGAVLDERAVETIDIFPTVTDVLGLPIVQEIDGQSLLATNWQPARRRLYEAGDRIADFESALAMGPAVARMRAVVVPGVSALESTGLGAGRAFFGQNLADLQIAAPAPRHRLKLDRPEWYTGVDMAGEFLPARLTGTLSGAAPDTDLLIALNGVIAGSGRTFGEDAQFSIMLDPRQFRPGHNQLEAFLLRQDTLERISPAAAGGAWRVEKKAGGVRQRVGQGE